MTVLPERLPVSGPLPTGLLEGHKKAIIAIARMMMVSIYHMVKDKQPFSPCDYEELLNPQEHPQRVVLNDANVFDYLNAQGYDTSSLVKCNDD